MESVLFFIFYLALQNKKQTNRRLYYNSWLKQVVIAAMLVSTKVTFGSDEIVDNK